MANDNVEIEIRIPLDEETFFKVKEKLKEIAKFVKTSNQKDEYFTPAHRNFLEPEFPFEWLSIRKRDDKVILSYKYWYPEYEKIHTHCDEFEIVLDIVKELGYFMEIEAMKNFGSVEETRKKLFEFAKNLGINVSKPDERGYAFLMAKKKGLVKNS